MKELLNFENGDAARLVNRQIILSNARVKAMREGKVDRRRLAYRIVAIEHDIGSSAREVANALAEEIGWQVFDREIVEYIAKNAHVREQIVCELDEKARDQVQDEIERFLRFLMRAETFGEVEYHQALLKTLVTLDARSESIMVGHGCVFASDDTSRLRIRFTASPDIRAQRLRERSQESMDMVRKRMRESDRNIKEFVQFHFKKNRDDLSSYDLVFNTDHLAIDKMVKSILAMLNR